MKKLLLIAFVCFFGISVASAQRLEIQAGYGGFSSDKMLSKTSDFLNDIGIDADKELNQAASKSSTGAFTLSVNYFFGEKRRLGLGVTGAYEKIKSTVTENKEVVGRSHNNQYTLALGATYRWVNAKVFTLYSSGSVGAAICDKSSFKDAVDSAWKSDGKNCEFRYHVSVLGASLGFNHIGIYAEAGWGYKGIINGGLYVRF